MGDIDFRRLLRLSLSAEISVNVPEAWSEHPAIWLCRFCSRLKGVGRKNKPRSSAPCPV